MSATLRIPADMMGQLHRHLFPGDGDEHGAVIAGAVVDTERGLRLLAHRLFLAEDGRQYVAGQRGYRMLTADFVMECVLECADLQMAYLAVHCHGGENTVDFSPTDLQSHERGYPALRDIVNGPPVGGLVFAKSAVAGDLWLSDGSRQELERLVVTGHPVYELRKQPEKAPRIATAEYDRQARLFGDRGQQLLSRQKVGVIGAGGAGSIVVEHLARLGVGKIVVIDPQAIEPTNLPRIVGSLRRDVLPVLTHERLGRLADAAKRFRTSKARIAKRSIRQASRHTKVTALRRDVTEPGAAEQLIDCDYIFLAADSMQARLVFNALVHQYVIPGAQMGVKAQVDKESGKIIDLLAVYRPVVPGSGCLWCNGLIPADKLQEEATDSSQLDRQRYVDDANVAAPSVITMNGVAASLATNGYLMSVTGLLEPRDELTWVRHNPRTAEFIDELPRRDSKCRECSTRGRLGRGPTARLPVRSN